MGLFGDGGGLLGLGGPGKLDLNRLNRAEDLYGGVDPSGQYGRAADQGASFGRAGAHGYAYLGQEAARQRGDLQALASGQNSISAEQLRQGLQQNISAQQSMAAGARPGNQVAAARQASLNAMRLGSGLAGQQAVAGLAERQQAQQALQQAILQQRQQDLQATLGGQQNALSGYGGIEANRTTRYGAAAGAPTSGEQLLGALSGVAGAYAGSKSDRRAKKNVKDGDADAERLLKGLKAYRYDYKDERDGQGSQLGVMAQDLERAGAGHAVIDTPGGKMVHGAKLATTLAATLPVLHRRLAKLEGKGA